jgi:tetratricopeptide (TPR) repeat protein
VGLPAPLLLAIALGASPQTVSAPGLAPDPDKELTLLRRRSVAVAPGTPAARALARDLERIGQRYAELGDSGQAIELLEEAYGWDEDNGLVLAELTLAYVREENFSFARFYLELAEQRAAQAPPEVYAALGEVYYTLNRVEDAVLAWEQFERLEGNDPVMLRRLARARQELSLSNGQRLLQGAEFSIYSDEAISPDMVERIADRLAESHHTQASFFGTRLDASQIVVLYAGRAYFSLVSVPEWVAGVFDGKVRICLDPDGGVTPALEGVLAHELAHALIRKASADRAPAWLHEGLAQWAEGKRLFARDFHQIFSGGRKPLSLSEMEGNLARKADRAAARANYGEALGLVEYLIQHRGPGAVICLLADLAQGNSMEEALRREAGLTPVELVAAWKSWAGL